MSEDQRRKVSVGQMSGKEYEIDHNYDEKIAKGPKFGCRHVQVILLGLGLLFGVSTRTNLSVAVVAMTDNSSSPNPDVPTYDWTNTSIILSSFFWSYITLQVIAGYLGKTYGPKYFYLVASCVNCCASALTPLAAENLGSTGVMMCRIVQGLGQGFLYPSTHVLLGRWVPEQERNTLCSIAFAGIPFGTMLGSLVTGFVSSSWWGWPASFYILSSLGFSWCILWLFFGQNSPATHPRITPEEKKYIQVSLKQEDNLNLPIPWKKIFTCKPFYALIVAAIGNIWAYSIMMTETPTYLAKVMNFKLQSNAIISSMPTLIGLVCGLIMGPTSDFIISRKYLTKLNARRTFHLMGSYGQALCLTWLAFLQPSQAYMSIVILGLSNAVTSFILVGSNVNHLDLSPRFSGILFGILNATGQGCAILGPLTANWTITDPTSASQWRIVFLITAVIYVVGGTVFFIFASATRQPWDGPQEEKEDRKKKVSVVSILSI